MTANEKTWSVLEVAKSLGLEITAKFIPFSQSRDKDAKYKSLNWQITITKRGVMAQTEKECNGYKVLSFEYSAGCGYCPSNICFQRTVDNTKKINEECETGFNCSRASYKNKPIKPDLV